MKQQQSITQGTAVSNILLIAFIGDAVLNLIAEGVNSQWLIWATKPLLMPLLCAWLLAQPRTHATRFRLFYAIGLFFSFGGDVLLMLAKNELLFILGLVSFLFTHLCYTYANTGTLKELKSGFLFSNAWAALPLFAFWIVLMALLWPGIPGSLKVPVGLYSLVITVMCLSALNLNKHIPSAIFYSLFGGAILFLLSDSLIAIAKFRLQTESSAMRLAIMSTYILGQFLIIRAVSRINSLIPFPGYVISKPK